ncbi:hypothetical protein LJR267_002459 [Paraburkholderia hospita]|jgi:hypothetical protein|uniref:hypothetical protein n=1 Tax=Paraburkholderia hospita TaxID=169430 RepID=UPI003DF0B177
MPRMPTVLEPADRRMSRRSARARTEENANARPGVGVRSGKPFRELKGAKKRRGKRAFAYFT